MEPSTLQKLISREIEKLNKKIDKKILNGKPYHRESQKHRALVAQYRRIQLRKKMDVETGVRRPFFAI